MASIATKNLNDRVKNDTFSSVEFTFQDGVGAAIDLTGATIACKFRYNCKTGMQVASFTIGSGITVTDAVNGIIEIDAFTPITWAVGTYYYDIEITFSSGVIKTYVNGTVKILQDVTYT